jgi:release factor glutamine methyltransferase
VPTIRELISQAQAALEGVSESPRLDAELLLASAAGISRTGILGGLSDALDRKGVERFGELIERRKRHEPVAYILGQKEFFGLEFHVSPAVLIPRPETELLVELALERACAYTGKLSILDLGTGSGCIAISLAHELGERGRECSIAAADLSGSALEVAKENARRHGVEEKVEFLRSDWGTELIGRPEKFQLIVSNPPYVSTQSELARDLDFEPKPALFAGADGLSEIKRLLPQVFQLLARPGCFLCEVGSEQERGLKTALEVFHQGSYQLHFHRDLAGRTRVMELES